MKTSFVLFSFIVLAAAGSAAAQDSDPATRKMGETSVRKSNFGTLTDKMIRKDDDVGIDATFDDDGKFETKEVTAADRFEGIWWTPKGEKECGAAQKGSKYWGKMHFKLSNFGRVMTGKWGYCDAEPTEDFNAEWQKK